MEIRAPWRRQHFRRSSLFYNFSSFKNENRSKGSHLYTYSDYNNSNVSWTSKDLMLSYRLGSANGHDACRRVPSRCHPLVLMTLIKRSAHDIVRPPPGPNSHRILAALCHLRPVAPEASHGRGRRGCRIILMELRALIRRLTGADPMSIYRNHKSVVDARQGLNGTTRLEFEGADSGASGLGPIEAYLDDSGKYLDNLADSSTLSRSIEVLHSLERLEHLEQQQRGCLRLWCKSTSYSPIFANRHETAGSGAGSSDHRTLDGPKSSSVFRVQRTDLALIDCLHSTGNPKFAVVATVFEKPVASWLFGSKIAKKHNCIPLVHFKKITQVRLVPTITILPSTLRILAGEQENLHEIPEVGLNMLLRAGNLRRELSNSAGIPYLEMLFGHFPSLQRIFEVLYPAPGHELNDQHLHQHALNKDAIAKVFKADLRKSEWRGSPGYPTACRISPSGGGLAAAARPDPRLSSRPRGLNPPGFARISRRPGSAIAAKRPFKSPELPPDKQRP
ncbi:unnamed protein product [Nesidiocoris tenuis]|uniref:Uncharacterized protein n=1 Tax=Nesidiocoris tenuis TaxID=355587 RepID=A0A6H5HQ71_9HEMI|nr:unnamed protein product [Nesidiocoris tenuis]